MGVVVVMALLGGGYAFLSGTADDVQRDVAGELDDAAGDPTPRATPLTTPRPTPAQTVNMGAVSFQLFAARLAETGPEIATGMFQVGEDAGDLDLAALTDSSIALWLLLGDEVDWVEDNPPHACYQELHREWSAALTTLYDALDLISDGAIYVDVDLMTEGSARMIEGNELVNSATDMVGAAAARCG